MGRRHEAAGKSESLCVESPVLIYYASTYKVDEKLPFFSKQTDSSLISFLNWKYFQLEQFLGVFLFPHFCLTYRSSMSRPVGGKK